MILLLLSISALANCYSSKYLYYSKSKTTHTKKKTKKRTDKLHTQCVWDPHTLWVFEYFGLWFWTFYVFIKRRFHFHSCVIVHAHALWLCLLCASKTNSSLCVQFSINFRLIERVATAFLKLLLHFFPKNSFELRFLFIFPWSAPRYFLDLQVEDSRSPKHTPYRG